ncbi:MAG: hypothetical protein ACJA08_002005 [Cyclobacteriaceae bacterium]|jgi:hypothetical protein
MLRFIFSVIILILGFGAFAQLPQGLPQGSGSSASVEPVTMKQVRALRRQEPKDWSIKYLKITYDAIPLGRMFVKPDQKGQEIQAAISFYKYFFVAEAGFQDIMRGRSNFDYHSSGTYFRLGPEVNMLKINDNGGTMTFGLRYAQSNFSDQLSFVKNVGFGENNYEYENPNARLIWMEITTGMNLNVTKNMYMGYTIRYKVFRNIDRIDVFRPFDIPGFGKYQNRSTMGFSYYIGWAIPFNKMEEVSTEVR